MFDHIFENRDRKITNIVKLSDYLGRSLRENVEVFSIDDTENKATFVTESGKIIAGSYNFDDSVELRNIQIEEGELFEDDQRFDDFVNYKISNFVHNIFEEDFVEADTSFSKVLQLWESRVKFSSVKKKLYEKSQKFNGSNRIIESEEFQKVVEIAPQLVNFLKENETLVNIPEIKNMVKLSSSVSKAFALPKISYDSLNEATYCIPDTVNHSVYDMICKQELIRKELVESKNSFDLVWLNNEKVSNLAALVYESDESAIVKALVEAVCEVPYLALATKRQITETLMSNLELNESIKVNLKDIKAYSSALFEYKKPLKNLFVSMLNEKYGISVQNLKDIPTFKSLLNTQVLIFEALAKLSPKGSVQKDVLVETASMLKNKNGVESIDVNHFIELLFEKAGYQSQDLDEPLIENISIKETFSEMDSIEELVDVILEKAKATKKKKSFPDLNKDGEVTKADILVGRGVIKAETEVEEEEPKIEEDSEEQQTETVEAVEELEEQETQEKEVAEKEPEESKTPSSDEIMSSFKDFEDILNSINFEDIMDDPGDEEEEDPDEEPEEAEEDAAEEETEE
tara:strand:+ start:2115 stop:3833 length:1719 start_codon:yes stop_codon:yes gene_type:complete